MSIRYRAAVLASLLALGAATPACSSKAYMQGLSSGHVGCVPEDIEIRDARFGLVPSWVAECGGKTYICNVQGSVKYQQASCAERVVAAVGERALPLSARRAASEPPRGGGGFVFGSSPAEAERACVEAGHAWRAVSAKAYACSGAPVDLGLPAAANLGFCGEELCEVSLSMRAAGGTAARWREGLSAFEAALAQKYGAATYRKGKAPEDCGRDPEGCTKEGSSSTRIAWAWPTGEEIELSMEVVHREISRDTLARSATLHVLLRRGADAAPPGAPAPSQGGAQATRVTPNLEGL